MTSTPDTTVTDATEEYPSNSYEDLILLNPSTRHTFLWVSFTFTTFSIIANCAAIYSISKRNYRTFQKTCIVSLALSDLLATVAIVIINGVPFMQDAMTWNLGSFLCSFLPMCQMTGVLASSVALVFIAMDRYRNVVFALSKRWNPRLCFCFMAAAAIWLTCFGISYPMYSFYRLLEYDIGNDQTLPCCILAEKKLHLRNYYIAMVLIIFFPLFSVFLWFYYSIASLVWKHRKPVSTIFNKKPSQEPTSSTTLPEVRNLNKPKTQEDIRVGRKIRTFKIIIALMVVFIVCRLPYFTIEILKSVNTSLGTREASWYMNFSFMTLHTVNCFLNPMLYTFLNLTLQLWFKMKSFMMEVCCFCCSTTEFESFETENPFVLGDSEKKRNNSKVRFEDEGRY